MPETYQSLSHSKWDCKYQIVFVPKRRRKAIFGQIRKQLGPIFHALARQKEGLAPTAAARQIPVRPADPFAVYGKALSSRSEAVRLTRLVRWTSKASPGSTFL